MDKPATETSAFFKYPANSINAIKYHTSKLHVRDINIIIIIIIIYINIIA